MHALEDDQTLFTENLLNLDQNHQHLFYYLIHFQSQMEQKHSSDTWLPHLQKQTAYSCHGHSQG